jgi:TolA-binding protein
VTLRSDSLVLQTGHVTAIAPSDTALRPLRTSAGAAPLAWARAPWFGAVQVVPLLLVAAAFTVRRRRGRPASPRDHARRFRREAAALDGADDAATRLATLERLLCEAALRMAGATAGDPVALLRSQGREDAAVALETLLFDMQSARYSPDAAHASDFNALRSRAVAFADEIGRAKRAAPSAAAAAAVALTALGVVAAGGAARAADAGFERGVALHQAGDAAAAANAFHAYARANPRDPSGWYNVGVASWHAGDPGRAAWAWLRALRHAPRDADTQHNLRLAAGTGAGAWLVPPDRLATGERLLLAAVAWWLLVLAGAFAAWTRSRRAALGAVAGLSVLLLAGATGFGSGLRGVHVVPLGQGASVHAGPSVHDDLIAQLAVGEPARVLERRNGWLLVAVDHDRRGWIERAAVAAP